MKNPALSLLLIWFCASSAVAQDSDGVGPKLGEEASPPAGRATIGELLSSGYEIKAAIPGSGKYVLFLQKDRTAYACEMQSLTASRCGSVK